MRVLVTANSATSRRRPRVICNIDADAGVTQARDAATGRTRVGIRRTDNDARDARLDDGARTRRRQTGVIARLERHVQGRAAHVGRRADAASCSASFRRAARRAPMEALADRRCVARDDRADGRIRRRAAARPRPPIRTRGANRRRSSSRERLRRNLDALPKRDVIFDLLGGVFGLGIKPRSVSVFLAVDDDANSNSPCPSTGRRSGSRFRCRYSRFMLSGGKY